MPINFTLQDILGILLAFSLFPFIFVSPGYVTGWVLNLFEFRDRTLIGQTVMAMAISASVSPAVLFLVYRFTSFSVVIGLIVIYYFFICVLFCLSVVLCTKTRAERLDLIRLYNE